MRYAAKYWLHIAFLVTRERFQFSRILHERREISGKYGKEAWAKS